MLKKKKKRKIVLNVFSVFPNKKIRNPCLRKKEKPILLFSVLAIFYFLFFVVGAFY